MPISGPILSDHMNLMNASKYGWTVCPTGHDLAHCTAVAKFWMCSEVLLQFRGTPAALACVQNLCASSSVAMVPTDLALSLLTG